MWTELPSDQKQEYKRLILAFASLTDLFAQKASVDGSSEERKKDDIPSPIINSKFQETVFQKAFHASAEDIGNTSYDAAIKLERNGHIKNYLVGIKTFGINAGDQKVAQFKKNNEEWAYIIEKIKTNANNLPDTEATKDKINEVNKSLYLELAKEVATLRNKRIKSSEANLRGFNVDRKNGDVESVYHVLMPSPKGAEPTITVGETSYTPIDIDNIVIEGCTTVNNPTNFKFSDKRHKYKYTPADCQLYMEFDNKNIKQDIWNVIYAEDAYKFFYNIAETIYGETDHISEQIIESYSWMLTNSSGEVEPFSGYNSFFGVGSKLAKNSRQKRIDDIKEKYSNVIETSTLNEVLSKLKIFLLSDSKTDSEKQTKVYLRAEICDLMEATKSEAFIKDVEKLIFRPRNEMYIPIPNSKKFHTEHPDFFCKNGSDLILSKEERKFNLVFEPSGDILQAYITQDSGKAIESYSKQSYLGEWVLRGIFQLGKYEQLTKEKLNEIGINAIQLYRVNTDSNVHLKFIWVDETDLPEDYAR